ncbi:MAG: hypothetical protein ACSHX7_11470 [Luteolibacter sp.]
MFSKILLTLLATLTILPAQELMFRQVADTETDSHVELTSLFSQPSLGGYLPVRVTIANNQKIPRKIYLDFKDSNNYDDSISTSSDFSFLAKPFTTTTYDIIVPLAPYNGAVNYNSFSSKLTGTMGENSYNTVSKFENGQPEVLLSEALYTLNASALDTETATRLSGSSYRGSSSGTFASKFNPKQLPNDWRAYSGFDTMMLSEQDLANIPPGARNAILSWVRLGGQLVVFSNSTTNPRELGLPADPSFGQIQIKTIPNDSRLDPKQTVNIAFGEKSTTPRTKVLTSDFNSGWPLQKAFGEKSFNYVIFIIILIIFGIVVGPVNLFVFAKSGQRHRLFITTPIISVTTSLILIALIIFQDGFGGDGSRLVLMEVRPDAGQNAAFVYQEQFSRTGVMTSPGFTVENSAFISPVPIAASRWARFTTDYQSSGTFDLQPSGGKLFATGSWFQSRSEQGQLISTVVPTRGRIEQGSNPAELISTFDFPIKTLLYRDQSGQYFRAENITKGKPIQLTEIDPTLALPTLNETTKKFSSRTAKFFDQVKDRSDSFVAITDAAPAIETHPSIDWKTTTVITGPITR